MVRLNSRVVVTGAGRGFGLCLTEYLLNEGAKVAAVDLNKGSLDKLKERRPEVETFVCDLTDNAQVEDVCSRIFDIFSGVEVLVNNAGIMENSPLINLLDRNEPRHNIELWDNVIKTNLYSVFYMTRSIVSNMIKKRNKGVIVNVSSIAAAGNIGQTAYSASKAGVEAMTKTWAKELGPFGIRSAAIAPGFINTQGTADALEERMLKKWVEKTPLRRVGLVDEVVKSIVFLIDNDFFNGEILAVNGGLVV